MLAFWSMTQKEFLTGSDHHVWWSLTLVLEIWVMCIKHSEYKLIVHSLICGYFWNWPDRLDKFFLYLKGINNLERSLYIKNKRYLTDMRVFGSEREREKDRETYNQKMVNIYVLYHLQETVLFYPSSCLLEAERQLVCEYFQRPKMEYHLFKCLIYTVGYLSTYYYSTITYWFFW